MITIPSSFSSSSSSSSPPPHYVLPLLTPNSPHYQSFFGALGAAPINNWIGRKKTLLLGCVIFTVGGVLQTAGMHLNYQYAGRFLAVSFKKPPAFVVLVCHPSYLTGRRKLSGCRCGYRIQCLPDVRSGACSCSYPRKYHRSLPGLRRHRCW